MTASRILVAILSSGSINIPVDNFISANNEDKQLSVTYNDETNSFQFELREEENEGNSEIIDN
jgi:hypothetical protein